MRISLRMVVAFLLTVALLAAPAGASAAPRAENGEAREGWFAALLRDVLEPVKSFWAGDFQGPMIDPSGIAAPPPPDPVSSNSSQGEQGPGTDSDG